MVVSSACWSFSARPSAADAEFAALNEYHRVRLDFVRTQNTMLADLEDAIAERDAARAELAAERAAHQAAVAARAASRSASAASHWRRSPNGRPNRRHLTRRN